jgi:hypothetical protein
MTRSSHRTGTGLAAAALLGAALLLPQAVLAQDGNQTNVSSEGRESQCTGGPGGSDITPGTGEVAWLFVHAGVDGPGELTANFTGAGSITVDSYIQGGVKYLIVTDRPETLEDFSDTIEGGQLVLSHTCYGAEESTPTPEPTATPEPEVTPTPEPEVTPTPEPEVTPTPEPEVTPTPAPTDNATPTPAPTDNATPTPAPSGTVEAETGTPRVTPPSTDAGIGGGPNGTGGLPIVLIALAGILATSLALLPRRGAKRQ